MKLLSLKYILLRYLGAIILIVLAGLLPNQSGLWLMVPVAVVSIKFLVYDGVASAVKRWVPSFQVKPWLLIGYGLAVIGDMCFVYGANLDEVDAGFAFFGTFLVTPWILGSALVVMAIATHVKKKP